MTHTNPRSPHPPLHEPPISLAEARRVIWQTSPKAPMGDLLDHGRLARKDLLWAIERAYRPDVRRAAQRLLQALDAPAAAPPSSAPPILAMPAPQATVPAHDPAEPPRYSPQVVTASEYLEDQESWHGWMLAYSIGLGVGLLIFTGSTALSWFRTPTTWLTAVSILGAVAAWVWLLWLIRRQMMRVYTYRAGRKGEATVLDALRQSLDQHWTIDRGGHSLRAGLITSAAEAGVSEGDILAQSGHKSSRILRGSIRRANLFKGNVASKVGL